MRDIEFRGWDVDNQRWVYGYYVKYCDATPYAISTELEHDRFLKRHTHHYIAYDGHSDWGLSRPLWRTDVDPESVGEFTGKYDAKGKKIFEGDFLAEGDGRGVVEYYDTEFIAMDMTDSHMCNLLSFPGNTTVIGNKYENKDIKHCESSALSSDINGTDSMDTTTNE